MKSLTEILINCEKQGIPNRDIMDEINDPKYNYTQKYTKLKVYYVKNMLEKYNLIKKYDNI